MASSYPKSLSDLAGAHRLALPVLLTAEGRIVSTRARVARTPLLAHDVIDGGQDSVATVHDTAGKNASFCLRMGKGEPLTVRGAHRAASWRSQPQRTCRSSRTRDGDPRGCDCGARGGVSDVVSRGWDQMWRTVGCGASNAAPAVSSVCLVAMGRQSHNNPRAVQFMQPWVGSQKVLDALLLLLNVSHSET